MKMKRLCAAALAGLLIITGVPVSGNQTLVANAAESTNVALSTAGSSVVAWDGSDSNTNISAVIDGDKTDNSRWSSGTALKNSNGSTNSKSYLVIDLGENTNTLVENIVISWYKLVWSTKYVVQTSDTCVYDVTNGRISNEVFDKNWETIAEVDRRGQDNATQHICDTLSIDASASTEVTAANEYVLNNNKLKRYVRFVFYEINTRAIGTNVSIKEIEINGVKTAVPAKFSKASLSLKDSINVNLYVNILNDLETDAQVEFSAAGKESKTISGLNQGKEYDDSYKVSYEMNAAEMTKPVTATISNLGVGNDPVTLRYSIKEYADAAMAGASESLQALIKAMLNYGAYSQINFNKTEDGLANAGYEYNQNELDAVTAEGITVAAPTFGTDNGVSVTDVSLLLKSKTILRFYLDVAERTDLTGATVTADGVTGISATIDEQKRYVQIEGIAAKDLDKVYTLTLSTGSGDKVVTYSPLNYVKTVLGSEYGSTEYTNIRNVAKTLYLYNQAAKEYFNN